MRVFHLADRAPWQIVAATKTLDEINETPDIAVRRSLMDYAVELVEPSSEDSVYAAGLGRSLMTSPIAAMLPDASDREIVGNAVCLRCDFFCTCDRRTIVSKREQLRLFPIRIATPAEWWSHIKP